MSLSPLQCDGCGTARVFDRAGKFPEDGGETTFAVGWRCPRCSELALDLCPTGPVEPAKGSCLNCGGELAGYHKLRARRAGSARYIDVHLQFASGTSLERAHSIAHSLQAEIQGRLRNADVLVHIEPARGGEEDPPTAAG